MEAPKARRLGQAARHEPANAAAASAAAAPAQSFAARQQDGATVVVIAAREAAQGLAAAGAQKHLEPLDNLVGGDRELADERGGRVARGHAHAAERRASGANSSSGGGIRARWWRAERQQAAAAAACGHFEPELAEHHC